MKPWFKEVAKTILVLRQDNHVVEYKIHQDQEAWRKIYEEDQRKLKESKSV